MVALATQAYGLAFLLQSEKAGLCCLLQACTLAIVGSVQAQSSTLSVASLSAPAAPATAPTAPVNPGRAAPPAQPSFYASPPGVVSGLFKANLSYPPTAYVSFQTVVAGLSADGFNQTLQQYYINSIASFVNESVGEVVILRIDTGSQSIANGPAPGNQSFIIPAPLSNSQPPANAPQPALLAPAPLPSGRRLLQADIADPEFQIESNAATSAIYIYTAVTLTSIKGGQDTSLSSLVNALRNATTAAKVVDPEALSPTGAYVQGVIIGKRSQSALKHALLLLLPRPRA